MVNKHNLVFFAAIVLFIGYYLQGILYPSGSFLSQLFLMIYLLIGACCAFNMLFLNKADAQTYAWGAFVLMLSFTYMLSPSIVHGTINEAIGEVSTFLQFKESLSLSFTYFIACYAGRNGTISDKQLFYLGLIFFLMSFIRFNYTNTTLELKNDGNIGFTNNAAYFIVITLPFLVFIYERSKILASVLLIISISLIIIGAKRGAILCLGASILFVLFYYLRKHEFNFTRYTVVIFIVCSLGLYAFMVYQSNEYLIHRTELTEQTGIGSRNVVYSMLFNHWNNEQDPVKFFFGNGTSQTINICGNYAHNDWLELLIDNGLFGFCIYLLLFIFMFLKIYRSGMNFKEKIACYCAFIIWFGKAGYSMGYPVFENAILFILLGILPSRDETEWEQEELNAVATNDLL